MVVDTAEERSRRILANHLRDEMTTTRVLVHERRNIVDEASNDDQRALSSLLLDCTQIVSMTSIANARNTHSSRS